MSNQDDEGMTEVSEAPPDRASRLSSTPKNRHVAAQRADYLAHALLLAISVGIAWFPVESVPWGATIVGTVILLLVPWGWSRSSEGTASHLTMAAAMVLIFSMSAVAGWDPSRGVVGIGLLASSITLMWLASRSRPPDLFPVVAAAFLAGLSILGLWQTFGGLEAIRPAVNELSASAQLYASERVASRRAFASLPLPSHLAVLLATALPLLLDRSRVRNARLLRLGIAALACAGLVATRSPVGLGLAFLVVVPVLIKQNRTLLRLVAGGLLVALVAVIVTRPDVGQLEPLTLRMDNWRTGVWLWTTSPASGVGVASFAQASQASPLVVGNRPAHAHSLPFEALAELGPVGLVGVGFLGVLLLGLVSSIWNRNRGLALAVMVVPLHNLLDFSCFVSGVILPWAVLIGWAVAHRRPEGEAKALPLLKGRIVVVVVATLALGMVVLHAASITIEEAAAHQTIPLDRFNGATQALEIAPWRVQPQFLLASAAIANGDPNVMDHAWIELDRLRWFRPRSAALARRRAELALARGDVSSALSELWAAAEYGDQHSDKTRDFRELVERIQSTGHHATR